MTRLKLIRWMILVDSLLILYVIGYVFAPKKPAGNLAYFVYSEEPRVDAFYRGFFLPAYKIDQALAQSRGRPFVRHNEDRPAITPAF